MFTINIEYTTGDSFKSYKTEDTISLVWKDKELARKALKAIQAHYEFSNASDAWGITPRERSAIKERARNEYWYCKDYPDYNIMVEMDDGTFRSMNAFWCGYFETLHTAEVITCPGTDDEDKIHFN